MRRVRRSDRSGEGGGGGGGEPDGVEGLQSKVVVEKRSGEEVVRHFRRGERQRGSRGKWRLSTSSPKLTTPENWRKKLKTCPSFPRRLLPAETRLPPVQPCRHGRGLKPPPSVEVLGLPDAFPAAFHVCETVTPEQGQGLLH